MALLMLAREALSPAQLAQVEERLALPVHRHDEGPTCTWRTSPAGMHAFFEPATGELVALASGLGERRPGWWVDSAFRGQGYGGEVVDLIAALLKSQGVTRVAPVMVATHQHRYDQQSGKLLRRLYKHFER